MTPLQMWKAFYRMCPLRNVSEWRPFGQDKLIVWFRGNRKIKVITISMIEEDQFRIEPSSDEEWLQFIRRKE